MGVLACDRKGCEHIMCSRLSNEYGYICDSCFEELISLGPSVDVLSFMSSTTRKSKVNLEAARARYEKEFPLMGGG